MPSAPPRVLSIRDAGGLQALCHPTRVEMLEALREPASAASVARHIGQPRQRINYHLKTLEEAGLVEIVETRQNGKLVVSSNLHHVLWVFPGVLRTFVYQCDSHSLGMVDVFTKHDRLGERIRLL